MYSLSGIQEYQPEKRRLGCPPQQCQKRDRTFKADAAWPPGFFPWGAVR